MFCAKLTYHLQCENCNNNISESVKCATAHIMYIKGVDADTHNTTADSAITAILNSGKP